MIPLQLAVGGRDFDDTELLASLLDRCAEHPRLIIESRAAPHIDTLATVCVTWRSRTVGVPCGLENIRPRLRWLSLRQDTPICLPEYFCGSLSRLWNDTEAAIPYAIEIRKFFSYNCSFFCYFKFIFKSPCVFKKPRILNSNSGDNDSNLNNMNT